MDTLWIPVITAAVGVAVVAFLTWYNNRQRNKLEDRRKK